MKNCNRPYTPPLLSLDFYLSHFDQLVRELKVDKDLDLIKSILGLSYNPTIREAVKEEHYDALVLTDTKLSIVWVSDGFSEMTGYSKKFAIGRSPHFLQGQETSEITKSKIRQHLNNQEAFTASILNYRRNGQSYTCKIKAMPIYNSNNEVEHYLAIERELHVA